jgi:hypothetical protein
MRKTFAPIVIGFSLLLTVPAQAAEKAGRGKGPDGPFVRALVLKGMLRHVKGELESRPPVPFEYWQLRAGGKTYYLDLRGKELLERGEKLVNRLVVVTGIPEPASPTLRVTSLKADEFVKETIHVEIRGKLARCLEDYRPKPKDRCPWGKPAPTVTWWISFDGGKSYQLDFRGRRELHALAKKLDGKAVVVTGTRVGEVIHVAGLKAEASAYRETVTVEIQGVLERVFAEFDVWLLSYPPRYGGKIKLPVGWKITAAGKTYTLDFTSHPELEKRASPLVNQTVVVTGRLKDGVVAVTGWKAAASANESVHAEIKGRLSLFACRPQFLYAWEHAASGQTYRLDFSGARELFEAARKLEGKFATVTGTGDPSGIIHVTGVRAGENNCRETETRGVVR